MGPNIALRDSRWSMDRVECGGGGGQGLAHGLPLRAPLRGAGPGPGSGAAGGAVAGSGTKKMRKRRELDALAKRCLASSTNGNHGNHGNGGVHKRSASGGLSSHDQLLTESSDDEPGYKPGYALGLAHVHGYTPGFAVKRRRPGRGSMAGAHLLRRRPCVQLVRACVGLLILACVVATLTVMWLFIDVREQVFCLRTQIEQVVAGSQAVPDDLQKIHSLSRELQLNQTQLTLRVNSITAQMSNLSKQLDVVQSRLRDYSDQLQSNPEPANVKELKTNVALWGSQIKDLDNTVRSLKQQQSTIDTFTQILGKNLTSIEASVNQLSNMSLRPPPLEPNVVHTLDSLRQVITETSANISEANSTLSKQLQWLQDDQKKDHKAIEGVQDLGQNITARIKTLEGECAKIDVQNTLNMTVLKLKEKVDSFSQQVEQRLSLLQPSPGQAPSSVIQSTILPVQQSEESGSLPKGSLPPALIDPVGGEMTTPRG